MTDYRYADQGTTRYSRTGKVRFRLAKRTFNPPLIVLQVHNLIEDRKYKKRYGLDGSRTTDTYWDTRQEYWSDAQLEDLSVMEVNKLMIQREGGEMPACFRPYRSWGSWKLVLQVIRDGKNGQWGDAQLQDLLFKEGNFLGGVGLVGR